MLSSDKNVESIVELIDALKEHVELQKEYLELNVIEKVVKLVTALTVAIIFVILGVAVLFYLTFAIVYWMEPLTGLGLAFFLVAVFFVALLSLVFAFRKQWIERPLVRFLATPKEANTKGELIANLVSNSITAIDAFILVRKLMKTYGWLFGRRKRK